MKKFLAGILLCIFMLTACVPGMVLAEPLQEADKAYDLLNRLGVNPSSGSGAMQRKDFAILAMKTAGAYSYADSSTECVFADVGGVLSGILNTAVELGYFTLPSDRLFRPEAAITYTEAATVCVRMLGYAHMTDANSYNVAQYLDIANRLKLLKGIDADNFGIQEINLMLYRTLLAKCSDTIYMDAGISVDMGEQLFIEKVYGIAQYTGRVESIDKAAATGSGPVQQGMVKINGEIYKTDEAYDYGYLNKTVEYYVTHISGEDVLFAMYEISSAEDIEVISYDSIGVDGNLSSYSYFRGNSKKTVNLSEDVTVVINGEKKFAVSEQDFVPECGKIRLSDGDGDGRYDIVVIESYVYYEVGSVDVNGQRLDDVNGNLPLELSLFDDPSKNSIVFSDGSPAGLQDITKGMVLEVMYSKNPDNSIDYSRCITIRILEDVIEGTIESVTPSNCEVQIENERYHYLSALEEELLVGYHIRGYIGSTGEIGYIAEMNKEDGEKYGYLVAVKKKSVIDDAMYVKMYTQDADMIVFETGNKIRFTGLYNDAYVYNKAIDAIELEQIFAQGELVKYLADEAGNLKSISRAVDRSSDETYEGYDEDVFTLEYKNQNGRLFGVVASENYFYSADSLLFVVPESGEDDDYAVGDYNILGEINNQDVTLYDATKDWTIKAAVVRTSSSVSPELTDDEQGNLYLALISSKKEILNNDGDVVVAYEAYREGQPVTLYAYDEDLRDPSVSVPAQGEKSEIYFNELNPGDCIQYKTNMNGEVNLLNVLFRYDKNNLSARQFILRSADGYLSQLITTFGKVTRYQVGSYFMTDYSTQRRFNFGDTRMNSYIYIFDVETGKVEVLPEFTYLNGEGSGNNDYVFVKTRRTSIRDVVIYRTY